MTTIEATVRDVATRQMLLRKGTTCEVVDHLFQADARRSSVLVALDGGCLLVNRQSFFQAMTGRLGFGRTLHYRRPVADVMEVDYLELDATTGLEAAALLGMSSAFLGLGADALVRFADGWGTVASSRLLQHVKDIHRQRANEVVQERARLQALVENAVDVMFIVAADGSLRYRSRDIDGFARTEVGSDAFGHVVAEDRTPLVRAFGRCLADAGGETRGEFRVHDDRGALRLFEFNARNLVDDPAVRGVVVNFRDITSRRELEDQLRHHASHDPLTGLANRQLLFTRATSAMARLGQDRNAVAMIYCDLDGFKAINDSFGHGFGDELLVEIARRTETCVRSQDTMARVGGDEFIVLVDDCDAVAARAIAERLLDAFSTPFTPNGSSLDVAVSIGYAVTEVAVTPAALTNQADAAMYAAKAAGGNRVRRFDDATLGRAVRSRLLAGDLRLAIARNELHLVFQPIVRVATMEVDGVEALLRWDHPQLGAVPPTEFIAIAEAQGLIGRVGQWVLDSACCALAAWPASERPRWISVNLSAHQLDDPHLADDVATCLARHGVRSDQLHVELTETAMATGDIGRISRLHELRAVGVSISLDDFGTGYSSLSALNHVPLDTVKIDRSFVIGLGTTPESTLMLRSIVDLAHALGHTVIAEGVEQPEELRILMEIGCDHVQGYLLGRPTAAPLRPPARRAAA